MCVCVCVKPTRHSDFDRYFNYFFLILEVYISKRIKFYISGDKDIKIYNV